MSTPGARPAPPRSAQPGRRPVTSRAEISAVAIDLFTSRGFEETSVDDVADAVGIARRTLFRYYPSKNAIAWGDFDSHLAEMRTLLADIPADLPMADALQQALISFNEVPESELPGHRRRMSLLLGVPALQAHSMLMYAEWRQVIAEFCAHRLGLTENGHLPQTVAWLCLGTALAAYDQWLTHPGTDLQALIVAGSRTLAQGVDALS
ncbi:mycofactocin system transcriptional regulator [Gordonia sp. ABSL11-1]|uniref:mycofactocin system transcriptional regulator n=1 Tax=Gordonia sp. ABSL11-1 TaxID=3053924 RepID=UPI002573286F|nr:mycofactocin system transcriptional regulator [Gordonia sp. ABSL11-1]MDL9944851.1 mycofactocin system transcriptional regulator [Gordonia sp. ABSL11-1]